ncbi:MAG: peptide chain release factor 2 [Candidatus Omnitrophota bacterium]|nr:peptide chain release factor 2 [Candidatus Omnitrophota bacterium]
MEEIIRELTEKVDYLKEKLQEIRGYLDVDSRDKEITALTEKMSQPNFWDRPQEAQSVVEKLKILKKVVDPWKKGHRDVADVAELLGMLDENQGEEIADIRAEIERLIREVDNLEFQRLLSGPNDSRSAILSLNAGAGGTESCDWAEMLLRMYLRWAEKHDYKMQIVDVLSGEEAGIKSATVMIQGPYAFGYLKAEVGVHRLVRISPFDSNKRRHTSFASVDVIAEVDDAVEIEVKDADLRIDTYRAGGAGGQHVNKTESAVRITHLPTKVVVQCQNERSQHQNKQVAMKLLKARLYERRMKEKDQEMKNQYGDKMEIAWGSQIRSYVFHPYTMVKDHRTDVETSNGQAVMDGDLDEFIQGYLKKTVK